MGVGDSVDLGLDGGAYSGIRMAQRGHRRAARRVQIPFTFGVDNVDAVPGHGHGKLRSGIAMKDMPHGALTLPAAPWTGNDLHLEVARHTCSDTAGPPETGPYPRDDTNVA